MNASENPWLGKLGWSLFLAVSLTAGWWLASELDGRRDRVLAQEAARPQPRMGVEPAEQPRARTTKPIKDLDLSTALALRSEFERSMAIHRLAESASGAELRTLIEDIAQSAMPDGDVIASVLLHRLLDIDAGAAFDACRGVADLQLRETLTQRLFYVWGKRAPEEALVRLSKLKGADLDVAAAALLSARYSEGDNIADWRNRMPANVNDSTWEYWLTYQSTSADPAAAFNYAIAQHKSENAYWAIDLWARTDPIAAVDAARSVAHSSLRDQLLLAAMARWAETQPQDAWEYAVAYPPPNDQLRMAVMNKLIERNPAQALSLARENGAADYDLAMSSWVEHKPLEVLSQVDELALAGSDRDGLLLAALGALAATDPDLALNRANALRPELRDEFLSTHAAYFAVAEFDRAMAWIQNIEDPNKRQTGLVGILQAAAQSQPQTASAYLSEVTDRSMVVQLAGDIAYGMAVIDPISALSWAESLPNDEVRMNAISRAASLLAERDPATAIERLMAMDEASRDTAINEVLVSVAAKDPELAMDVLADLRGGESYEAALIAVVGGMAGADAQLAAQQVDELSPQDLALVDVQLVTSSLMSSDENAAADWLANTLRRVDDDADRQRFNEGAQFAMGQLIYEWKGDSGALQSWIRALPDNYRNMAQVMWLSSDHASYVDVQREIQTLPTMEQRREVAESAIDRFPDVTVDSLSGLLRDAGIDASEASSMLARRDY